MSASEDEARPRGQGTEERQTAKAADSIKAGGAARVDRFADSVERAARELDGESGTLSQYAGNLAGSMHSVAARLRERSVDDLAGDLRQLARRNPTLFALGSIGVGIALARFLKAASPPTGTRARPDERPGEASVDEPRFEAASVEAPEPVGLPLEDSAAPFDAARRPMRLDEGRNGHGA